MNHNPTMADGSSVHWRTKQQLHNYISTYIQPLMRTGKQMDLKDILHHVNIRKPKLVQQLGTQHLQLEFCWFENDRPSPAD